MKTGLKASSQSDATPCVALIREMYKFIIKGFLDDQTQERNAGESKDRARVYPSVVLRFYKRRRRRCNAMHYFGSYCEPAFIHMTLWPLVKYTYIYTVHMYM